MGEFRSVTFLDFRSLRGQELAHAGAQHRAAVGAAAEGRLATALAREAAHHS